MSKFWQKRYISKYTGEEIDAAVGNVPVVTSADAGKALVVDEEGKIVPGEAAGGVTLVAAPQAFETSLTTAIQSLAAGLAADTKLHKATFSFNTEDADFADIVSFYDAITNKAVRVLCGNIGTVYAEITFDGIQGKTSVKNYIIIPGLGMGEVILLLNSVVEATVITEITCDVYVRRIEQAT